jgi:phosphoserine phosphatase
LPQSPTPADTDPARSPSTSQLSTQDLFTRVHALAPKVAVFDCDGTLWSGDAGSAFMRWTMGEYEQPAILAPAQIAWLNTRYQGYLSGDVSELAICGEMVQVYRGLSIDTLRRSAADFFRLHVEPNIFPEMGELIASLQRLGTAIWAVSSTCDWVIDEGVRRFHIPPDRVLAARVATANGLATETLLDVPTDEGKVASLLSVGITAGMNAPDAVFGNSIHDAAMLSIASAAFPINPSHDLLRLAATRGWPVYFPASVTP